MPIKLPTVARNALVYPKTYLRGAWRPLTTVRDNGAGDSDRRPGFMSLAGANRTTFVQIDNNRRPGDDDLFFKAVQNARGAQVGGLTRLAPLAVTRFSGMKKGATISIYDANQKKLLSRVKDNSGADLDISGNIKLSTLVRWNQTVVVHIRNLGARTPVIRAFRNGNLVAVPPKPPSGAAKLRANQIASLIKSKAGTIALYLSQSALRNNDTVIKENLKRNIASAGIQRNAVIALDSLRLMQSQTFVAQDGTKLRFNDVLRIAGAAKTGWSVNSSKVTRFQRLRNEANREVVQNARIIIASLKNQKIKEVISRMPLAFSDMSNIGVQLNSERINEVMSSYANVMDDYLNVFKYLAQYSGKNFTKDVGLGDNWQKEIDNEITRLNNNTKLSVRSYTSAVVAAVNTQKANAERQKIVTVLNIAAFVLAFGSVGVGLFATDKGYIWDAVSAASNGLGVMAVTSKTASELRAGSFNALRGTVVKGSNLTASVNSAYQEFKQAELKISMVAPGLQTKEVLFDRRPETGIIYTDRDPAYIGYSEKRRRYLDDATGWQYDIVRTYYKRWLMN